MASQREIAQRWVDYHMGDVERPLMAQAGNVLVDSRDRRNLLSYGSHFTLSRAMVAEDGKLSHWLLNGDTYSSSTSKHQSMVRAAVKATGKPVLIVPFSAIAMAGIRMESITPIDLDPERFVTEHHSSRNLSDLPRHERTHYRYDPETRRSTETPAQPDENGVYHWGTRRHFLGASVLKATHVELVDVLRDPERPYMILDRTFEERESFFLSAFDDQETRPLYFLAQLPGPAETVAEALESLKPEIATDVENYTRQGDIFAVPSDLTTRQLRKLGATIAKRTTAPHAEVALVGTDHTATEVATLPDGSQFARGLLYHDVWPRERDHARRKMHDGKTWHRIARNTVPWVNGRPRAWSIQGNVD